jgi:CTP-dependent riboflavin kinase
MTGRKPEISDRDILDTFAETNDPVLSAPEVADVFDYSNAGVYKRLRDLHDRGLLATKKVGQGRAWWLTDAGREFLEVEE